MELITITNGVLALVIIGLTQLLKKYVSKRYITLVPVVLGILGVGALIGFTTDGIFTGIVIGLTTAGLYDQKKLIV